MNTAEPRLTAPMATALLGSRPTIMVSTMAMLIQPSSASTSGIASRSVGPTSARKICVREVANSNIEILQQSLPAVGRLIGSLQGDNTRWHFVLSQLLMEKASEEVRRDEFGYGVDLWSE